MYLDISNDLPSDIEVGSVVEPFHTQAWVDREGTFYAVNRYGHDAAAHKIIKEKGIPTLFAQPVRFDYDQNRYVPKPGRQPEEVWGGDDTLEMLGWVHLRYNGEFQTKDRYKNKGRISEDQFFVLQALARKVGIRQYQDNMLHCLRDFGGHKWLQEIEGVPGPWYAPDFTQG